MSIDHQKNLFPDSPLWYIRGGNRTSGLENIEAELVSAFDEDNQDSAFNKLGIGKGIYVNLAFMNYGNTQLVYLASAGKDKFAVLINQPHTPLGVVKDEFENLRALRRIDERFVVNPLVFVSGRKGHELYVSEYIDNALCIAYFNAHGVFNPLPVYHFEKFTEDMNSAVDSAMIAMLVRYHSHGRGLGKTESSGNDFMLTRDFRMGDTSTVLPNMRLIAARGWIHSSLDEYLKVLREEFLIGTRRGENDSRMRVNCKSSSPMTSKDIHRGIDIGMELRVMLP